MKKVTPIYVSSRNQVIRKWNHIYKGALQTVVFCLATLSVTSSEEISLMLHPLSASSYMPVEKLIAILPKIILVSTYLFVFVSMWSMPFSHATWKAFVCLPTTDSPVPNGVPAYSRNSINIYLNKRINRVLLFDTCKETNLSRWRDSLPS